MTSAFDQIAHDYGRLWDDTDVGRLQRDAVWRYLTPLFHSGDTVLDLGCGTGDDALRFARSGVNVAGIDASSEMVRIARERGVNARLGRIEDIGSLQGVFDGVVSDFGALNCVADLPALREPLGQIVAPSGHLVVCVMGRLCLLETIWYLLRGDLRKAARRWKGSADSSLGCKVFYPTVGEIARAFSPAFELVKTAGIGVLVPPSFIGAFSREMLRRFDRIDRRIAGWPLFASIADHRILVFRKRGGENA
jgi:SAM-dependent methyltransferase